ncbi:hypothetical protein GCM10011514_29060 [Emticicia aquatilis]|uniref:Uncharacterized protein n=1 Tax=Emticicia aquatilis TaxID=1537369 RepID=A0A916YVR0_9BACT|nr:hypothetical protein GCM10011514_29060 [Emticicia aquatilis]
MFVTSPFDEDIVELAKIYPPSDVFFIITTFPSPRVENSLLLPPNSLFNLLEMKEFVHKLNHPVFLKISKQCEVVLYISKPSSGFTIASL